MSPQGWAGSSLGAAVSAVALAQVEDRPDQVTPRCQHPDHLSHNSDHLLHDHHHQVKLHSADERGEVEGSEGGRVPDMYVVVR